MYQTQPHHITLGSFWICRPFFSISYLVALQITLAQAQSISMQQLAQSIYGGAKPRNLNAYSGIQTHVAYLPDVQLALTPSLDNIVRYRWHYFYYDAHLL